MNAISASSDLVFQACRLRQDESVLSCEYGRLRVTDSFRRAGCLGHDRWRLAQRSTSPKSQRAIKTWQECEYSTTTITAARKITAKIFQRTQNALYGTIRPSQECEVNHGNGQ